MKLFYNLMASIFLGLLIYFLLFDDNWWQLLVAFLVAFSLIGLGMTDIKKG